MKFIKAILLFFFLTLTTLNGQSKKSGDYYFFQYAYAEAIQAYENQLVKGELNNQQYLNLADAYFKTDNYEKASDNYLLVYKRDSLMGNHHFNKMLQSFSKTSDYDRVDAFLSTRSGDFRKEWFENGEFNSELLGSDATGDLDFQIFNIGGNSPQSDFSPAFYGEKLLFSSSRPQGRKSKYESSAEGYLDIFVGVMGADGEINNPDPFSSIPPSNYHKATPYYSEDLRGIFYVMSNIDEDGELSFDDNGKNALAIAMQLEEGPFRLLLRDLGTSFYYPYYDSTTGKLYFAANFKDDGYGGTDLYFVYTNNGQIMSAPINLGPRINSPGNEIAPFIFENSLYFSSDVFYGLGGMDVYKSNIEDETSFSIPINLGKEINSTEDDFGLIIKNHNEGLLGYFSSNREGGKGNDDIYCFKVDEKPGLKTLTLRGKVVKPYKGIDPISKASVKVLDTDGNLIKEVYSDNDGNYRLEIPWRDEVIVESSKDRYSEYKVKFDKDELEQFDNVNLDIGLAFYDDLVEQKENQTIIKLRKFFFGREKTTITAEIAQELDKVVSFVKRFPQAQLRIETHTDSRGGSSTNFRLTQTRSDKIKKYLLTNGVPAANILYSIGYGEDKILNNCKNGVYCLEMLHQQNQRSLIVILNDNILFE